MLGSSGREFLFTGSGAGKPSAWPPPLEDNSCFMTYFLLDITFLYSPSFKQQVKVPSVRPIFWSGTCL